MTSEQLFHILGMRHVWDVLKALDENPMSYTDLTRKLNLNNAVTYRLLLLLTNAGVITRKINTYHMLGLGRQLVRLYVDLDTPRRVSWDDGDVAEMVV